MEETKNTETSTQENTQETEKTYSEKEFQSEVDKRVSQALKKQQTKYEEQMKEAEKLARMNEQEKLSYELEKKKKELDEREAQITLAETKSVAIGILNEKGIDSKLVDLVLGKDSEETNTKIKILEEAFNASVAAEITKRIGQGKQPKSSVGSNNLTREDVKKMSLSDLQKLANSDPTLYKSITQ